MKNFKDYVDLFLKDRQDEDGNPLKVTHEVCGERWEIAVCPSEFSFKQISFVNNVATTKVKQICILDEHKRSSIIYFVL